MGRGGWPPFPPSSTIIVALIRHAVTKIAAQVVNHPLTRVGSIGVALFSLLSQILDPALAHAGVIVISAANVYLSSPFFPSGSSSCNYK
jgi:hypothetical protein